MAQGLHTIIFKFVYWYMNQISGERLQDHWSSGFGMLAGTRLIFFTPKLYCLYNYFDMLWF